MLTSAFYVLYQFKLLCAIHNGIAVDMQQTNMCTEHCFTCAGVTKIKRFLRATRSAGVVDQELSRVLNTASNSSFNWPVINFHGR